MTILSTRILSEAQQELILNSGHGLVHYDCLKIIPFEHQTVDGSQLHVIITSSNAIAAFAQIPRGHIAAIYCVGDTTAARLSAMDFSPTVVAGNGKQLAQIIVNNYRSNKYTYLCGKDRRDELPSFLQEHQVNFKEVIVYESVMVHKSFDRKFAAVLMFSPRGVYAFAKANNAQPDNVICIGETTAQAAREFYKVVHVATKQTVENVIVTAIKILNNDKK